MSVFFAASALFAKSVGMVAACVVDRSSPGIARGQDAWTAFWQEPGQSQCISGAPDVAQEIARHWSSFVATLTPGARVLDLGCGAGAVARTLLAARSDVHITGIDFARIPLVIHAQVELLSDTAMEALPFVDGSFAAVVSQFGYEYSHMDRAAEELVRVLAPNARFSFLVHHAGSSIVATNRARLSALVALLGQKIRTAFCGGDAVAFNAQMAALKESHASDPLIAELAHSLPSRLGRSQTERAAIWNAIDEALAPELWILKALDACCVAREDLDDWLEPLRYACEVEPVSVLRAPGGGPIAWRIDGARAT